MSDPSFAAQLITFTYPHIGNYGTSAAAMESARGWAAAAIMRDARNRADAKGALGGWLDWLAERGIPAITGVDTRTLVRHIRDAGAMRGGLFPAEVARRRGAGPDRRRARDGRTGPRLASSRQVRLRVCTTTPTCSSTSAPPAKRRDGVAGDADTATGDGPRVAVLDTGVKASILRHLLARGRAARASSVLEQRGGDPREQPRRDPARQRPRRSRGGGLRRGHDPRARRKAPAVGDLPRTSAALSRARPRDLQAALRPPRGEPSRKGPPRRTRRDHLPEPRLRGPRPRGRAADIGRRPGRVGDGARKSRGSRT